MTDKIRSEATDRFAGAAHNLKAVLAKAGNRMKRLSSMPQSSRIRNLCKRSVAKFFKYHGELYQCFRAYYGAIGRLPVPDPRICKEIERKLRWFCDMLAIYLGPTGVATVAKFKALFERLMDLSEEACSPAVCKEDVQELLKRLSKKSHDVFEELYEHVTAREMLLRNFPVSDEDHQNASSDGFGPEDRKTLRQIHKVSVFGTMTGGAKKSSDAQIAAKNRRRQVLYGASLYRRRTKYSEGFSAYKAAETAIESADFVGKKGVYSRAEKKTLAQAIWREVSPG